MPTEQQILSEEQKQPPCGLCSGPHEFDTVVPSAVWNAVIRARNLPDYLCATCIVREFVRAGQSFTAQLWGDEFHGINVELRVEDKIAQDATLVSDENTTLRVQIRELQSRLSEVEKERDAEKKDHELTISVFRQQERIWQQKFDELRSSVINLCKEKAAEWQRNSNDYNERDGMAISLIGKAAAARELADKVREL